MSSGILLKNKDNAANMVSVLSNNQFHVFATIGDPPSSAEIEIGHDGDIVQSLIGVEVEFLVEFELDFDKMIEGGFECHTDKGIVTIFILCFCNDHLWHIGIHWRYCKGEIRIQIIPLVPQPEQS